MSATITLSLDTELAGVLAQKAAIAGVNVEQFALDALRRMAELPARDELPGKKPETNGKLTIPLPAAIEARDGVYYIAQTSTTLAAVITRFKQGLSPEEIRHECFPSLSVNQVLSAVGLYLNHRKQVEDYLQQFQQEGDELQAQLLTRYPAYIKTAEELRERLSTAAPK